MSDEKEMNEETEKKTVFLQFTKEVFDGIYASVEAVAMTAIANKSAIDELGQIISELDKRIEELEKASQEE